MDANEDYFKNIIPVEVHRHPYLGDLLEDVRAFVGRFVVAGGVELDAITLWVPHSYVFEVAYATPYLHAHSPEPGSGKTTLLDVLAVLAKNPIDADNLTEAVLFRLIEAKTPTLLFDEVDAVFGKKNSDSVEGIRQVLNSGYRKGKRAWRCVPPSHELKPFNVFCPKALSGLRELPGTLAHRSIPIAMKPPLPSDVFEDFDPEQAFGEAEDLRRNLEAWAAESMDVLIRPELKPAKMPELDARGNEIWRLLFRIADQAGGDWPERARDAARELSGADRRRQDASPGIKLLAHIKDLFQGEKMFCGDLVHALNELDDAPYGGWNLNAGISTRELGKKLVPYGIRAKSIRIENTKSKGYERAQFEDSWGRYFPQIPPSKGDRGTTRIVEPETGESKGGQEAVVPLSESGSIPHQQSDVPLVPLSQPDPGDGDDDLRDETVVLRLVPEDAATEAALLAEIEQLVAEGIGTIEERPT
jgi:hypothetical protein